MLGPTSVPGNDGKFLHVGVDREMISFWILPEVEQRNNTPTGGWYVRVKPDIFLNGVISGEYKGKTDRGNDRVLTITIHNGRSTVREYSLTGISGKSVTVDSEELVQAVRHALDRILKLV